MNASQHASSFLFSVDPRLTIQKVGRAVFEAAENDPEFATMLDTIQRKLGDGRPLINEEQGAVFDKIKTIRAVPDIPTAPDWLRPVIAAAYLKAKASLSNKKTEFLAEDLKKTLSKVIQLVDDLEPEFIGELMIETTLSARDDKQFAKSLADGAAEFRALVSDLYGEPEGDRHDKHAPIAAARASSGAKSRGSCTVCRGNHCEPISCWAIVVVVIIIIVAN